MILVAVTLSVMACDTTPPPAAAPPNPPQTVDRVLSAQSAALLRGDEAGFVADIDAERPSVLTRYHGLYTTLRALKVTGWQATALGDEGRLTRPDHPIPVTVGYCLGVPVCPDELSFAGALPRLRMLVSFAVVAGHLAITDLALPSAEPTTQVTTVRQYRGETVMPWQLSDLVVASGARTVVATPRDHVARLPTLLAAAEAAAAAVDKNDQWVRPSYYYVYAAGDHEWTTWYPGAEPPQWAIGLAIPTSAFSIDVLLKVDSLADSSLEEAMRHEMGHVMTLLGAHRGAIDPTSGWVYEGIAEYLALSSTPAIDDTFEVNTLNRYLSKSTVDPSFLTASYPKDDGAVGAYYAAGYLAIRYLGERFGAEARDAFVSEVLRAPTTVVQAASDVFGQEWEQLLIQTWVAIQLRLTGSSRI